MDGILGDFISNILASFTESIGGLFFNIAKVVFDLENSLGVALNTEVINTLLSFSYSLSVLLLLVKFLYKGVMIYCLGRDGDDNASPIEYVKGVGLALLVATGFPIAYKYLRDITIFVCDKILSILAISGNLTFNDAMAVLGYTFGFTISGFAFIIYIIFFIILYFKFLKMGAEMIILRLGVPFAAIGLVNSDSGAFKPYMQQFLKTSLSAIVMLFCVFASIKLVIINQLLYACVFLMLANSFPTMLNQFLLQGSNSGGIVQKASSAAMMISNVRSFFK